MKSAMRMFMVAAALACPALAADAPATAPANQALSPAVEKALRELAADEFSVREKAVANLQVALGEQLRSILTTDDPETQQRLVGLLEYQEGISRWAIEVLKTPQEVRGKLLTWGLKAENTQTIAQVYSSVNSRRVEGIKALGASKDEEASWLLANLLNDESREVYLAAMEAVWDRKPTDGIVEALWNRSVESGMSSYRARFGGGAGAQVVFRGRALGGVMFDNPYRRAQDSGPATDTLIQLKAPQLAGKVTAFLAGLEKDMAKGGNTLQYVLMPWNEPTRNLYRIIEAYKMTEAAPFLVKFATADVTNRQQMNVNGKPMFSSNRTAPLLTLIKLYGKSPEDYKFIKTANAGYGIGYAAASEKDETEAAEKIKKLVEEKKDGAGPAAKDAVKAAPEGGIHIEAGEVQIGPGGVIELRGGGKIQVQAGRLEAQQIIIEGK